MSTSTYFVQECPTCGRRLHIRVEYLGKRVVCQHCRGQFLAADPSSARPGNAPGANLLKRADELIEDASQYMLRSRDHFPVE